MIIQNIKPYIGQGSAEKSPAIAVGLVTRHGEVVVALGNRDIFTHKPPDGNTLFGIGSVSKLFTGLILANAVANKELSLSDKANDWLEEQIHIDDRITLQQLVSHFSGLPNFPDNIMEQTDRSWNRETAMLMPAKDYSRKHLKNCLTKKLCCPRHVPGKKYLYSNMGIGLLSIVLQNRYGFNDFNTLNQEKITHVLSMKKTATNIPSFIKQNKANLAQGYQYIPEYHRLKPVPFSNMGVLAGAGELISCVNDMNLLLNALTGLSKSPLGNAAKELKKELGGSNQPSVSTAYAHKVRSARDGGKIHFKTGYTAGYSAIVIWRDMPKIGLVVLSNRGKFPTVPLSQRLMGRVTQLLKQ
ncbi:serine hydrolase domain-containing protein [Desulfobacula phenolica]|nr:serine hydrolase domain-containing protein [Desulfobacula phenolica]